MMTSEPTAATPVAPAADPVARLRAAHAAFERAAPAANGHAWLGAVRAAAMERFAALGLPTRRDEAWRKTSLAPLADARFHVPAAGRPPDGLAQRVADLSPGDLGAHRLVFVDGHFAPDLSRLGDLPEGAHVAPLAAAAVDRRAVVEAHLAQHADWRTAPFVALNTAFLADGAFIHVAAGTAVAAPLHVLHLATSTPGADGALPAAFPRTLCVAEAGATLTLVETFAAADPEAEGSYFVAPVTEIVVPAGAKVTHVKRQEEGPGAIHLATLQGHQTGAGTFATHGIDLGGRIVRNYTGVRIAAAQCETLLHGLYMVRGEQHVDNHTYLDHLEPHCHSFERYKGILDDRATAVFTGHIMVYQDAQKTDAVQENSAVLLSRDAMVSTQPQLEIFADDVKCTHGATVGELSADQLLYLRARGIPEGEAQGILTYAFANEIVAALPVEALRDDLERQIRARMTRRAATG